MHRNPPTSKRRLSSADLARLSNQGNEMIGPAKILSIALLRQYKNEGANLPTCLMEDRNARVNYVLQQALRIAEDTEKLLNNLNDSGRHADGIAIDDKEFQDEDDTLN